MRTERGAQRKTAELPEARRRTHLVVFDDPATTLSAVKRLRAGGYTVEDVHSPFPIHGLEEALGARETRLGFATLVGGILGCTLAFMLQIWTHAVDWPLNIGGKTNVALPGTVPVAFELTVLFAAFATVGGLLVRSRLRPKGAGRTPPSQPLAGVTDDRFAVLVSERDASFSVAAFRTLLAELHPLEVHEGWRVQ